ncbi:MAG TPA: universal stress protein [Gammaproteobacteria bacterium]|jgi:nucleotide-binding universal stress UspA family protein|nr:universal stress protein [Gammaproteobacteria bacterium]
MKLQRIMVATKPWERGLPIAANHARQLAPGAGDEIEIVGSVFDAAVSAGQDRGEAAARKSQDRTVASARAGLERLAVSMRESGARVTTRIVWGTPPYEAILAAAHDWQADLLVVGTHEPGTAHTRLTDTDWQLLRRARCPLLLVKSVAFTGYRTILAAIDPLPGSDELDLLDGAVLATSRCVAKACGSTVRAVEGFPACGVIDAAANRRADLVVVGAARQHGLATAVVGNTAELVAGQLACDVLIVPVAEEPLPHAACAQR